ncbi:MAG: polysaccharide biosynthesis protein [Deltaproteobacteria bacterium]|nr:MAG: polysaccharide biosynthesis protein [Deltaproteobacteria bacterium]
MKTRIFYKNFLIVAGLDVLILIFSLYAAYLVRFEFDIPLFFKIRFLRILPIFMGIKILCFYFFDLYAGMWRYTSVADLINIIKAATGSTLLMVAIILFGTRFVGYPRSVFLIDWCFTILFIAGFRLAIRFYFESTGKVESWLNTLRSFVGYQKTKIPGSKNLLIIGAGDCGEKIYREIRDNARLQYHVIGFLDDNPVKIGNKIHGIPVLGGISDIKFISSKASADEALIAIPSANAHQMRKIVYHLKESGIEFKTIPGYGELINGRITVNAIREVAYRDLIGREPIKLDENKIGAYLHGQTVLVTGAGGSIGSELCRQICRFKPENIVLYERAESPLYEIELELKKNFKTTQVLPILGDVQNIDQLEKTFDAFDPQSVFHAAAYKHVPMLELQPWKAVENNILGTANLVDVVKKFNVERFVFVSTDKAVRPTNIMGATKRVSEMLIQSQNNNSICSTRFTIVRFGNVVGSVGSVVPLFKKQIAKGGPVTVTHPEVTRYFMTIPEACQLILQAGALAGENCVEIYLLDMGTPINIDDMARDLIRWSGFEPDVDIKIEYIGLRPGEKLYEELITEGEGIVPTSHEKIMALRGQEVDQEQLNGKIDELMTLSKNQDTENIKQKLKEIAAEYRPS